MQKLLNKQNEEQQNAYTRWRNANCREIVAQNKKNKAEELD